MRTLAIAAMLCLTVPAIGAPQPSSPKFEGWTGPKPAKPPCECRSRGGKVPLGQTMCMRRGGKMVTMQCALVLNNTSWRQVAEGCDVAMLSLPVR